MNILFLAPQPFYSQRGTPIAIRAALEALSESGHAVDLLTYFAGEDIDIANVRLHRIPRPPLIKEVPIGPSWSKVPCNVFMLVQAYKMLRRYSYDVIHGVEDGAILARFVSRRTGHPYVYDMDSHMSGQIAQKSRWLAPVARLFEVLESDALKSAAGVLAVCPALAEIAERYQDAPRVALLPDMPLYNADQVVPSQEITRLGGTRIVYVGNLQHYQGVHLLLEAFARIVAAHPEAKTIIVGGSPEDIERHARPVRDLVDGGRVHFLGPRPLDQLGPILMASDILVSPRLQGVNTPMKLYSYLESGRPVLATRLVTHTQILDDNVACLVKPVASEMGKGILKLVEAPELRARLGAAGQELVRSEYGRERFNQRLRSFYRRL
ncbi:MAG: glycosyltransferase [Anaerolineales bacterium]|nr:glycosyltransferase [Anaerolineales bacterium]